MIAAREGRCCRFLEEGARELGRTSMGVRGISMSESDEVVGAIHCDMNDPDIASKTVLVVSENGFGKRSEIDEYRTTARGAKGVKTINITEKTGPLVSIQTVTEDNDLMLIPKAGLVIRMAVTDIRVAGRATQGVKLINIREGDSIAAVSVVAHEEEQPEAAVENQTNE